MPDIPAIADNATSTDITDNFLQNDALIRFYFKENPDKLSDFEYASRIKELAFLAKEGLLRSV